MADTISGQIEMYEDTDVLVEPVSDDDAEMVDLDYEFCIARAGLSLDKAGIHAEERQDIDALLKVSYGWMNLADKVAGVVDSDEDAVDKETTMGFGINHGKEDSIGESGI